MARKGAGMTLKQIQEEEIKKFDALMGEIGHKTITTGKPVDTEAMVKQFLLSAMEASAKGAIEADRQQLLKAVEEMETKYLSLCGDECITKIANSIRDLLKAKDYMGGDL